MTIPSPMKLPWFHILLALSDGSLHGYAIQRAVLERTGGRLTDVGRDRLHAEAAMMVEWARAAGVALLGSEGGAA